MTKDKPTLEELADQLLQMTGDGYSGSGSPDRLDALVWAVTEHGMVRVQRKGTRSRSVALLMPLGDDD